MPQGTCVPAPWRRGAPPAAARRDRTTRRRHAIRRNNVSRAFARSSPPRPRRSHIAATIDGSYHTGEHAMQWLWACFDDSSAAAAPPPIRAAPLRTANMLAMAIAWRLSWAGLGWVFTGDVIRAGRRRLSRGGSSPNNYRRKKAARAKTSPAGRSADVRARGRQKHADPSESVRASATPSTANSRRKRKSRRISCLRVCNLLSRTLTELAVADSHNRIGTRQRRNSSQSARLF